MRKPHPKIADTLWAQRLWKLTRATGWTRAMTARAMKPGSWGSPQMVNRILYGGIPKIDQVLAIKRLEREHAEELEAYAQGIISWVGHRRFDFRARKRRPADLADLGAEVGVDDEGYGYLSALGGGDDVAAETGVVNSGYPANRPGSPASDRR